MTMTRDEALLKIKKCMALSKSAEPHEAAVALRQAQKLMEQFSVNEQDMSLLDVHEEARKGKEVSGHRWAGYNEGQNAELNNGVAGRAPQQLIGG
jgi:hypothetical protein